MTSIGGNPYILDLFGANYGTSNKMSATIAYKLAEKDPAKQIARGEKDSSTQREIANFKRKVADLKTPDDLFKDKRLLDFVMKAVGLGNREGMEGIFRKAMSESPSSEKSMVNKLPDKAWLAAAQTLQMDSTGVATLQSEDMVAKLSEQFARASYQSSLTEQNSAIPIALYFKENAANVTSVLGILGDTTMRKFVTTALQLPDDIAIQPVSTQVKAVAARLDVKDFQSPEKVDRMISRFLINADKLNGGSGTGSYILNLFA